MVKSFLFIFAIFIMLSPFYLHAQEKNVTSLKESDIIKKYFDLLREVNNLYQEVKLESEKQALKESEKTEQKNVGSSENTDSRKEVVQETKQQEQKTKPQEPQGLYAVKYNVELIRDFIEKDLKKLLHDEQAQAVFYEDGTIEVTDVKEGHRKIAEYIDGLKSKYLKVYSYEIYINNEKKYSGTVSPIMPSTFSKGGSITCIPKDEYLLVNVLDYLSGIQAKFILPQAGGQHEFLSEKFHVRVVLKDVINNYKQQQKTKK